MMFSFIRHVIRNNAYTVKKARRLYATRKAMKQYAKDHPACEWCGRDGDVDVHHIIPVSVLPERAGQADNMISLCADRCHLYVGHNGNYRSRYVPNIRELCAQRKVIHSHKGG